MQGRLPRYARLSLQTFFNIDRNDSLHVSDAFRNASLCGKNIYRRVYLKVRESESKEASAQSISTEQPRASFPCVNSENTALHLMQRDCKVYHVVMLVKQFIEEIIKITVDDKLNVFLLFYRKFLWEISVHGC